MDIGIARIIWAKLGEIESKLRHGRHVCMFPGCRSLAIGSHSQQDCGQLKHIAERHHVVALRRNMKTALMGSDDLHEPVVHIDRIGIHNASVFKGFCNKHDTELFELIERKPLLQGDVNQVLAFHRRAVAYELWNKQLVIDMERGLVDDVGCDVLGMMPLVADYERLLAADRKYAWQPLWGASPISEIEWKWRVVNKNLGVSLTSCIPPLDDSSFAAYMASHYDVARQAYGHARPFFSLSIVPIESCTHIVMCWNRCNSGNVEPWVNRFIADNDLSGFLNECVFCKSEDYCLRPSLWDSLSEREQSSIRDNLHYCETPIVPNVIVL